ncbi:chorismate mutase [Geranomyces variabilis]|nr:chorismate mutase [Geranomyces variabilis]KAJ3135919.1 chorismate mutase aro7 [Geranomyces variabilis]
MDFLTTKLTLDTIRQELVRLEDSIIFALIERAQFAHNTNIYSANYFEGMGFTGTFLQYFLHEIESVHARVRRYTSPDEYPFTKDLPEPVLPPLHFPQLLAPNTINVNDQLMSIYLTNILPLICQDADDSNYGSAATKDVDALQCLSRRIHFGKFVAEAKFNGPEHDRYVVLIKAQDRDGLMELLTNVEVEKRLLARLRRKALVYGQEIEDHDKEVSAAHLRIPLDVVSNMYERYVIPLTKEVEVEYLLGRLQHVDKA